MGILAGSLPTLKPLFKQGLGSYASRSTSRPYTYGSKPYRLQSLSRSGHQRSQTLRSGNHTRWEVEADQKVRVLKDNKNLVYHSFSGIRRIGL